MTEEEQSFSGSLSALEILAFKNGTYQGETDLQLKKQGKGVFYWNTGEFYYGSWKDGIMHGQGVFYFSLGGLVFGSFLNGKADGLCQLVFPNKDSVTGRWKEGKLHGICVKYFEAHKSWALCEYDSGELLKTMKRGTGKPLYEVLLPRYAAEDIRDLIERKTSVFDFDEERPLEGIAHLAFGQNSWFHGAMSQENPNGIGNMQYNYRKHERGFFKDGHLQGNGRMIFANGDIFDGYFHRGAFDGLGVYFRCKESKWLYGLFKENCCVQTIKTGTRYPIELIRSLKTENLSMGATYINEKVPSEVIFLAEDEVSSTLTYEQTQNLLAQKRHSSKSPTKMLKRSLASYRSPESSRYSPTKEFEAPYLRTDEVSSFLDEGRSRRSPKPADRTLEDSVEMKSPESRRMEDKCFAFLFTKPVSLAHIDEAITESPQPVRSRMKNLDRGVGVNTGLGLPPKSNYSAKSYNQRAVEQMKRETPNTTWSSRDYENSAWNWSNQNGYPSNERENTSLSSGRHRFGSYRNKYSSPLNVGNPNQNLIASDENFFIRANNENDVSESMRISCQYQPSGSFCINSNNTDELKDTLASLRRQLRKKGIAERKPSIAAFEYDFNEYSQPETQTRRPEFDFVQSQAPSSVLDDLDLNASEFEGANSPVQTIYVSSRTHVNFPISFSGDHSTSSRKYAKPQQNVSHEISTFVSGGEQDSRKNPLSSLSSLKIRKEQPQPVEVSEFDSKDNRRLSFGHVNPLPSKRNDTTDNSPIRSLLDNQVTFGNIAENRGSYDEPENTQNKGAPRPDPFHQEIRFSKTRKNVSIHFESENFTETQFRSQNNNLPKTLFSKLRAQNQRLKITANRSSERGLRVRSRSEDALVEIEYHVKPRNNVSFERKTQAKLSHSNSQGSNLMKKPSIAEASESSFLPPHSTNSTPFSSVKHLSGFRNANDDSKSTTRTPRIVEENRKIDAILNNFKYPSKEQYLTQKNGDLESAGYPNESSFDNRNLTAECSSLNSTISSELMRVAGIIPNSDSQFHPNPSQALKKISDVFLSERGSVVGTEKKISQIDETEKGMCSISTNWVAQKSNYFDSQVVAKNPPRNLPQSKPNAQSNFADAKPPRAKVFSESQSKIEPSNLVVSRTLRKTSEDRRRSSFNDLDIVISQKVVESKLNSSIAESKEDYSYSNSDQARKEVETIVRLDIFKDHKYSPQVQKRDSSALYNSFDSKAYERWNSRKGSNLESMGSDKNHEVMSIYQTRHRFSSIKSGRSFSLTRSRNNSKERMF